MLGSLKRRSLSGTCRLTCKSTQATPEIAKPSWLSNKLRQYVPLLLLLFFWSLLPQCTVAYAGCPVPQDLGIYQEGNQEQCCMVLSGLELCTFLVRLCSWSVWYCFHCTLPTQNTSNNVHGHWPFGPMHACLVVDLRRLHACLPKCDICVLGCQTVQCPSLVAR